MRSFRLAFRTFLACASFTILPLVAIADPPVKPVAVPGLSTQTTAPGTSSVTTILPEPSSTSVANPKNAEPLRHPEPFKGAEVVEPTENPQILSFPTEKLEVDLPKGWTIRKREESGKIEYAFSGPRNADDTQPGVMFFLLPFKLSDELPSNKAILDIMMKPGKTNLKNFQQQDNEPLVIDGRAFESATFTGLIPDGTSLEGFFYVGRLKTGFLIFTGRNGGKYFKQSEETLRGIVKSCKVQG
jgi:hypothetical protein